MAPRVSIPALGYVGATGGFVIANVVVNVIGLLILGAARLIAGPASKRDTAPVTAQVAAVIGVGILLIGPFVASALGAELGGLFGLLRVYRRRSAVQHGDLPK